MADRRTPKYHKFTLKANERRCPVMMSPDDHKALKIVAVATNKSIVETLHNVFTQGFRCLVEEHEPRLAFYAKKYGLRH